MCVETCYPNDRCHSGYASYDTYNNMDVNSNLVEKIYSVQGKFKTVEACLWGCMATLRCETILFTANTKQCEFLNKMSLSTHVAGSKSLGFYTCCEG